MKRTKGKIFSFINNIYVNIKQSNTKISIFHLIAYIIEVTHVLISLDIIFNKDISEINLYFPLYFISPIFLSKFLISKFSSNCTVIPYEIYKYDQMSLILSNTLKLPVYNSSCSLNIILFSVIGIMAWLFILFIILGVTQSSKGWVKVSCTIMSYCIFFIQKTFLPLLTFILIEDFANQIFCNETILITPMFFIALFGFVIFSCCTFFFRKFLLNSYLQNEFLQENHRFMVVILEFFLIILDAIIVSIRINFTHKIFFESIALLLYIVHLYFLTTNYIHSLYKTIYQNGRMKIHLLYFCLGFVKMFFFILLYETDMKTFSLAFKIFELLLTLLLFISINQSLNSFNPKFPLSQIVEYSFLNFKKRYSGIKELYLPLIAFLELHLKMDKSTESHKAKDKSALIAYYKKMLVQHFIISENDIEILDNENFSSKKKIQKFLYMKSSNEVEEFKLLIKMLINTLKKVSKGILKACNSIELQETIKMIKIVLFFIYDEKTFRAQYFLSCISNSDMFSKYSYHFCFLISYLHNTFFYFSQIEEHSMIQVIHSIEVDEGYLRIIKSFQLIALGIQKSKREKMQIIDRQNEIIGEAYNRITMLSCNNENSKIKDQYQLEKYRLVDILLFTSFQYKALELFDLTLLEGGPSKNTSFILTLQGNELNIKKIPYKYVTLTGFKSSSYLGKDFAFLLSPHTRDSFMKDLKKNILNMSKNVFIIKAIMPTHDGHIIGISLKCYLLPLFTQHFYIVGVIEPNAVTNNLVLMNKSGTAQSFGSYYSQHFGLSPEMTKVNFLKLFNTENFMHNYKKPYSHENSMIPNVSINNDEIKGISQKKLHQTFSTCAVTLGNNKQYDNQREIYKKKYIITLEKLMENITKNITFEEVMKTSFNKKDKYIQTLTEALKSKVKYNDSMIFNYTLQLNQCIIENNEEYCLVSYNFDEILNKKQSEESLKDSILLSKPNYSIIQQGSGSSILSSIGNKENNWSIQDRKKQKNKLSTNAIIRVILIYDIFLIISSIIFLVVIKVSSVHFIYSHSTLMNLLDLTIHYFMGQFYISNMINIEGNTLTMAYEESINSNLHPSPLNFKQFYKVNFQAITAEMFPLYGNFISNISLHYTEQWKAQYLTYPITLIKFDGTNYTDEFLQFWNIPKNNYYILSNLEEYTITMPSINNISNAYTYISKYNTNQRIILSEIINYFSVKDVLVNATNVLREQFDKEYHSLKIEVYVIFFLFIFLQFISFFLSLYGVTSIYQQLIKISDGIISSTPSKVKLLLEKLKQIKKLIKAEQKPSVIFTQLKDNTKKIKDGSMNSSREFENNNESQSLINTKKAIAFLKGSFKFKVYRIVLRVILILTLITFIYAIIGFPILTTFFDQITKMKLETCRLNKFQITAVSYYVSSRYMIYVNQTDLLGSTRIFLPLYSNYILANYSLFKTLIDNDSHFNALKTYFEQIDSPHACEILFDHNEFLPSLIKLCNYQKILLTPMETVIGFFINKIRYAFTTFHTSPRFKEDQIADYHFNSYTDCNFQMILYFFNFVMYSKNTFLYSKFHGDTYNLLEFLIIIFIIMVLTEITNFFILIKQGTMKLTKSLENFLLLEKFFMQEHNEPKKSN